MRLLLDAHVSGKRIGKALRDSGHDVTAVDEETSLQAWTDDRLLALAASQNRILVTFNVRDFPDIAREWAEEGRKHSGCAIVVGLDHSEFGKILKVLDKAFSIRGNAEAWTNLTFFVSPRLLDP